MGTGQINPGRSAVEYYAAVKEKFKEREGVGGRGKCALCAVLEASPGTKAGIISFAYICIKKLEGDIKN